MSWHSRHNGSSGGTCRWFSLRKNGSSARGCWCGRRLCCPACPSGGSTSHRHVPRRERQRNRFASRGEPAPRNEAAVMIRPAAKTARTLLRFISAPRSRGSAPKGTQAAYSNRSTTSESSFKRNLGGLSATRKLIQGRASGKREKEAVCGLSANRNLYRSCARMVVRKPFLPSYFCQE